MKKPNPRVGNGPSSDYKHCYFLEQYQSAGIDPFVKHTEEFIAGKRTVPVTRAPSLTPGDLFFAFSSDLYRMFLNDLGRISKPYECALKYGFRGYSSGGKTGVFLIRRREGGLITAVGRLTEEFAEEITEDLECVPGDLPGLGPY